MGHMCMICGSKDWPVVDMATGFTFCDFCRKKARSNLELQKGGVNLANWLRAIADTIDEYNKRRIQKFNEVQDPDKPSPNHFVEG